MWGLGFFRRCGTVSLSASLLIILLFLITLHPVIFLTRVAAPPPSPGLMVGPVVGGLLSRPAVQYPGTVSESSVWGTFPYLLPCAGEEHSSVFLCISLCFFALLSSSFVLRSCHSCFLSSSLTCLSCFYPSFCLRVISISTFSFLSHSLSFPFLRLPNFLLSPYFHQYRLSSLSSRGSSFTSGSPRRQVGISR